MLAATTFQDRKLQPVATSAMGRFLPVETVSDFSDLATC
jgi:hypothetical protein